MNGRNVCYCKAKAATPDNKFIRTTRPWLCKERPLQNVLGPDRTRGGVFFEGITRTNSNQSFKPTPPRCGGSLASLGAA